MTVLQTSENWKIEKLYLEPFTVATLWHCDNSSAGEIILLAFEKLKNYEILFRAI